MSIHNAQFTIHNEMQVTLAAYLILVLISWFLFQRRKPKSKGFFYAGMVGQILLFAEIFYSRIPITAESKWILYVLYAFTYNVSILLLKPEQKNIWFTYSVNIILGALAMSTIPSQMSTSPPGRYFYLIYATQEMIGAISFSAIAYQLYFALSDRDKLGEAARRLSIIAMLTWLLKFIIDMLFSKYAWGAYFSWQRLEVYQLAGLFLLIINGIWSYKIPKGRSFVINYIILYIVLFYLLFPINLLMRHGGYAAGDVNSQFTVHNSQFTVHNSQLNNCALSIVHYELIKL